MKKVYLLLILLLHTTLLFSQENKKPVYIISGKVIDVETKKPLEYATVVFKDKESSRIQCGAVTNSRGFFSIEVSEGNYEVTVEYISYLKRKLNLSYINKSHHIGNINMSVDVNALEEVEVVGEKKVIEIKPQKLVYNVSKDVSAAGGSISDVISNIPSVSETSDGSFSVLGANATIMINGKTSALSKKELLNTISAGSIERIEVISNPGAKYKASYQRIINIILKKGKTDGLNAAITGTAGNNDYVGGLLLLNQKSKKANFHAFTSYNSKQPITISEVDMEYLNNGSTDSYLTEKRRFKANTNNFTGNIGVDFYLSQKATFSTAFTFSKINNTPENIATTYFYDANRNLIDENIRNLDGEFDNTIYELTAEYEQQFTKENHSFSTSIVYTNDTEEFYNNITNTNGSFTNEN
ncbi:MAG TPA: carboxypeptidase-like regulatory domain-containing protein, partial [Flavobacteriaceae bacterium]|nr:carboxypeptidase-like regulatory domain-containing protein [Flavobacteriaceae bacterium]